MRHTHRIARIAGTIGTIAVLSAGPLARPAGQEAAPAAKAQAGEAPPESLAAQLRVQITIARYSDGKKVTSLPFTLWATADGNASTLDAGQRLMGPPYGTQEIGTHISCRATLAASNRMRLNLSVRDVHLSPPKAGEPLVLKSLETNNVLHLRDGQTAEFVASTDLVTGEVTRIEVTASVMK